MTTNTRREIIDKLQTNKPRAEASAKGYELVCWLQFFIFLLIHHVDLTGPWPFLTKYSKVSSL